MQMTTCAGFGITFTQHCKIVSGGVKTWGYSAHSLHVAAFVGPSMDAFSLTS